MEPVSLSLSLPEKLEPETPDVRDDLDVRDDCDVPELIEEPVVDDTPLLEL